jgi:hypothetical protein
MPPENVKCTRAHRRSFYGNITMQIPQSMQEFHLWNELWLNADAMTARIEILNGEIRYQFKLVAAVA